MLPADGEQITLRLSLWARMERGPCPSVLTAALESRTGNRAQRIADEKHVFAKVGVRFSSPRWWKERWVDIFLWAEIAQTLCVCKIYIYLWTEWQEQISCSPVALLGAFASHK